MLRVFLAFGFLLAIALPLHAEPLDRQIGEANQRISQQTDKETKKLLERPGDSIKDAPGNVVRETGKAVDSAGQAVKNIIKCPFGC